MKAHDLKKDGQISFEEFKQIFDFQQDENISDEEQNQIDTKGPM